MQTLWTKKAILKSARALKQLGIDCPTVEQLPLKASIKEINEAWEIDRNIAKGIANDITIWT